MKNKNIFGIILIITFFLFINCSSHGTSNVTIHINLGLNNASAVNTFKNSIFDRIFRIFTKDAEAQSAPSHIDTITLNITGSGMEAIHQTYTKPNIPDSISLEVESGPSRLFEVLAYTASATLRGAVTQSLLGGTTVTIPIHMSTYETKIIIPDYVNSRIVQMNDMTGAGWSVRSAISGISTFRPYDVAFDRQGRIYIANNRGASGMGDNGVIRLNHFTDTSPYLYPDSSRRTGLLYDYGIVTVAIDINNHLIYYARSTTPSVLYREDLNDITSAHDSFTTMTTTGINIIRGIAVDDQGLLYIAGTTSLGNPAIFIYNPSTQSIVNSVTNSTISYLVTPWHVLIKGNLIYIANLNGSGANSQIIRLNTDLTSPVGFGQNVNISSTAFGDFYGPRRFVAILNRKLTIIDDEPGGFLNLDKLVSIDDISGTNWGIYGNSIVYGGGGFDFYDFC